MASFTDVVSNALAKASDVQQIIDALKGTIGKGIPLSPTAVNDAIAFALSVKNLDATNSRAVAVYKADGTTLLQIDKNGVQASPDGSLAAAPVLTSAPGQHLTTPVLSGSGGTPDGTLGWDATNHLLLVGDGTAIRSIQPGPWTAWTPTASQSVALTVTVNWASYALVGKIAVINFSLTITSAGTSGSVVAVAGLPAALAPKHVAASASLGSFFYLRAGVTQYTGTTVPASSSTLNFVSTANGSPIGATPAFAAAANDVITGALVYEVA